MLTFCHWRKLKKPYYALIKLLLLSCALFFLSTLPWQQNLASLVAGTIFGTALTFALVPFINVTKYNRKSKVIFKKKIEKKKIQKKKFFAKGVSKGKL